MIRDKFKLIKPGVYEMPKEAGMLVPARIYASEEIFNAIEPDAIQQLVNTAYLPGIQKYAFALPDIHSGYGFPIGGVAAMDVNEGVVSPGGVGYDINCGVRLVKTNLTEAEIRPKLKELINALFQEIPAGVGETGKLRLTNDELDELLVGGAEWAVKQGYGLKGDLEGIEEYGRMPEANPGKISDLAKKRGRPQTGTLGSGNHFLEIQKITEVFDEATAEKFGLRKGQITVMIHCGSRGLGHQVASDYINVMLRAMGKYNIKVPDRQLNCAPITSQEGQDYLHAMNAAINYAFANRQMIMHWARGVFEKVFGRSAEELGLELLYDVCHNIAKFEEHDVDGVRKKVLVHRKGATRAFPAGRQELSEKFRLIGQPAIIPGSMGTASYVMLGTETGLKETFGSVNHGAGRVMSRHGALRQKRGSDVLRELEAKGEVVKSTSMAGLAEEMPEAYKDIEEVVEALEISKVGKRITKHVPLGVMKG